jgi:hypothetical protein
MPPTQAATPGASIKEIGAFFAMTSKDMVREWKICPENPSDEEARTLMTVAERAQIRQGITDGSLTY